MKGKTKINWASVNKTAYLASFWTVVAVLLVQFLCGCATTTSTESQSEHHRIESLVQRMDSIVRTSSTVQQDTTWRETLIRQLQSIRERNDTSHTVVVDTAGRVIRETTVIYRERETVSESDRQEREYMMHRLERMDSVTTANSLLMQRIDSLVQASQKQTVVVKQQPWYQRLWDAAKYALLGALGCAILLVAIGAFKFLRNKT